ncbi:MAG: cyclic nucleotide-binding domain-containing protein [Magnetococcales bacterium]|nr:cyclic nucleotide-binding domain-containing protein [Magnetococcales bacterium]
MFSLPSSKIDHKSNSRTLGRHFKPGETIFNQGDLSSDAYIVQQGQIELVYELNGKDNRLQTLKKGEIFGVTGLFGSGARMVTARAKKSAWIMKLDRRVLMAGFYRDPSLAIKIFSQAFQRVNKISNKELENKKHTNVAEDCLEEQYVDLMDKMIQSRNRRNTEDIADHGNLNKMQKTIETLSEYGSIRGFLTQDEYTKLEETMEQLIGYKKKSSLKRRALSKWIGSFHTHYLFSYSPGRILVHSALAASVDENDNVKVVFLPVADSNLLELMVYAPYNPKSWSLISATLARAGISVVSAFLYSSEDGKALSIFRVHSPATPTIGDKLLLKEIQTTVEGAALGWLTMNYQPLPIDLKDGEDSKSCVTVDIDHKGSSSFTSLNVIACDFIGVLHVMIAYMESQSVFIHGILVSTVDNKTNNLFFLKDENNNPLKQTLTQTLRSGLERELAKYYKR